jgi:hypothetical protein
MRGGVMGWTAEEVDQFYLGSLARHASVDEQLSWAALSQSPDLDIGLLIAQSPEAVAYADPVERLYMGAFGRFADAVDPDGNFDGGQPSGYWVNVNAVRNGLSIGDLAEVFVGTQEFQLHYGTTVVSSALVVSFYENILGRAPTSDETSAWLNSGLDAAHILVGFTESAEFKANSQQIVDGLVLAAGHGHEPEPFPADLTISHSAAVVGIGVDSSNHLP